MNDALTPTHCNQSHCLIFQLNGTGHDITTMVYWPLQVSDERNKRGKYEWTFYLRSKPGGKGFRVKKRELCQQHHVFFLDMFSVEARADRIEQEQTDAWMIKNKGKL